MTDTEIDPEATSAALRDDDKNDRNEQVAEQLDQADRLAQALGDDPGEEAPLPSRGSAPLS